MATSRRIAVALLAIFAGVLALAGWRDPAYVEGTVAADGRPIAGARVRWQGAPAFTASCDHGRFRLPVSTSPRITAWMPGFRIGHADSAAGRPRILLHALPATDNPDYVWLPPDPDPARAPACGNCHQAIHEEWAGSAHARAATNPRLLTFIDGVDGRGRTHASWNLHAEQPLGAGVCSRCHAPTYESIDPGYDLRKVEGVARRGVHCDLCHKISDVPIDDRLGQRFGIDGLRFLRPRGDDQIFYGPLEDAVRPGESFGHFPLYRESRYCASCHEGKLFGVDVYTTYSEWLDSPARLAGVQCQDCHMTPTGKLTNIAPGKGGIERDPMTLASHAMPGADRAMLAKSLRASVRAKAAAGGVAVVTRVETRDVGHRVPTGFIDHHLTLVVEAWDAAGNELPSDQGPRLDRKLAGAEGGRAGVLYGRWLVDDAGNYPLPFWLRCEREVDTRLFPERVDEQRFRFVGPVARVRARLIYRKFWPQVAQARGWTDAMTIWEEDLSGPFPH